MTEKTLYRKKTRELLMRLMFQMMATGDFSDAAKQGFLADTSLYDGLFDEDQGESADLAYFDWAFLCVRDNLSEIDSKLDEVSQGWSVQRMDGADLAILIVAAAELLYVEGIDTSISISEAVLLAKKYGTEKSA